MTSVKKEKQERLCDSTTTPTRLPDNIRDVSNNCKIMERPFSLRRYLITVFDSLMKLSATITTRLSTKKKKSDVDSPSIIAIHTCTHETICS